MLNFHCQTSADTPPSPWLHSPGSVVISDEQLSHLQESRALYLPNLGQLTLENQFYLGALATGHLLGIPLSQNNVMPANAGLRAPIGRVPSHALFQRWASEPLTDVDIIEPFPIIAETIARVKETAPPTNLHVDPTAALHVEAQDFTRAEALHDHFFYLQREGLHIRRSEMLADLGVTGIRQALNKKGRATLVNFGPGPFPLERSIVSELTAQEREKTTITGIDVSQDLLRYGLEKRYIDSAFAVDAKAKSASDFQAIAPEADVVVFAEILEHIDHDAVVFQKHILPWLQQTGAMLIGSVPNAVQLAEYIPMIVGSGAPHQLRRPIFDVLNDHHSFHTPDSLAEMLTDTWDFQDAGIVSNGVRIEQHGNAAHLYAGLKYVAGGDRLVFWGRNLK